MIKHIRVFIYYPDNPLCLCTYRMPTLGPYEVFFFCALKKGSFNSGLNAGRCVYLFLGHSLGLMSMFSWAKN